MDFVLNRQEYVTDSDGIAQLVALPVNCRVSLDEATGHASFFEEMDDVMVLMSVQEWECLPNGTRADFTSEQQCVDFYLSANNHIAE